LTLKRQLLLTSLLMLLIPWAGLQFVIELDEALREQAREQLVEQATRLERLVGPLLRDLPPVPDNAPVIYAQTVSKPPNLDGYGSDWPGYDEESGQEDWHPRQPGENTATGFRWQAAATAQKLYLQLRIPRDPQALYNPSLPDRPYDYLSLRWVHDGESTERMFRTTGQGRMDSLTTGRNPRQDTQATGYWQNRGYGYRLELALPRPDTGSQMQFGLLNSADTGNPPMVAGHLVSRQRALEQHLHSMLFAGQQAWILENGGWLLAITQHQAPGQAGDFDSLGAMDIADRIILNGLRALVRAFQPDPSDLPALNRQLPAAQLTDQPLVRLPDGDRYLMKEQPLGEGRTLILLQSLDRILALSGDTLGSVISRSTLLIMGLMLVLLGYASWLSLRITRLQKAIDHSVDPDGRILAPLPPSRARDEIGDLSRRFSHMTERLEGYTRYLESFSRRLAHELKTPVAVVRSSLDNLPHAVSDEERDNYLSRARTATQRLSRIIHGMSEASRLEQSLEQADHEAFELAPVLAEATRAYQTLDPDHVIRYQGLATGCPVTGSPELLVQMLDKLVDNARDFTPDGGQIIVALESLDNRLRLSVTNEGSQLPEQLASDIFSPFVTVREPAAEGHLGQGLLIVRLIADHHRGTVAADNVRTPLKGVRFTVTLPRNPESGH
jgi:two-component system sensor histidine kinase ChvG